MITHSIFLSAQAIELIIALLNKTYVSEIILLELTQLFDDNSIELILLKRYSNVYEFDTSKAYSAYDTVHNAVQRWNFNADRNMLFVFMIDLIVFNHLASDVTYYDIWYIQQLINQYSF